jgi:pimeloyl-ACP methyl ester carboxylesterase
MIYMTPTSHYFYSQRLKLHYLDWGNPDNPLLILVHGGMDHARNWDWFAAKMRDEYHIVAVDLRGHGDSEWSNSGDYRIESFMLDLDAFLVHLGEESYKIVAHSLGGNVVVRYAGFYPEKFSHIVAIEGLGFSPKMHAKRQLISIDNQFRDFFMRRRDVEVRQPKKYLDIDSAASRMRDENKFLTPEQAHHLTVHGLRQNEDGTYSWKFDNFLYAFQVGDIPVSDIEYLWGRISCPTLLVYGADSWASNPANDGRLDHFNHARLNIYDNAGHWVQHEQLDKLIEDVRAFLKE